MSSASASVSTREPTASSGQAGSAVTAAEASPLGAASSCRLEQSGSRFQPAAQFGSVGGNRYSNVRATPWGFKNRGNSEGS
jgi:hypothetical protein